MSIDKYTGLSQERFDTISSRYVEFQRICHDPTTKPVVVYDKLTEKSLKELYLNREVSKELQKKKEEDMMKAAQLADEGKVVAKEAKTETQADQQSTETEK